MKEMVYIAGKVYKESVVVDQQIDGLTIGHQTLSDIGVVSIYTIPALVTAENYSEQDKLIKFNSIKTDLNGVKWHKTYISTTDYRQLLGIDGGIDINSLGLSLCPVVDIWGGVAQITENPSFTELYFNVTSSKNMQDISAFYQLKNPLPVDNDLDSNRSNWTIREYKELGIDLVLGSVVFDNKTPIRLKIYKLEKD
jgi:hypothetical protein